MKEKITIIRTETGDIIDVAPHLVWMSDRILIHTTKEDWRVFFLCAVAEGHDPRTLDNDTLVSDYEEWKVRYDDMRSDCLMDSVCEACGVTREALCDRNRRRECVEAREIYCHFAHEQIGFSTTKIGENIGRDHATVIHNLRKYEDDLFYSDFADKSARVMQLSTLVADKMLDKCINTAQPMSSETSPIEEGVNSATFA